MPRGQHGLLFECSKNIYVRRTHVALTVDSFRCTMRFGIEHTELRTFDRPANTHHRTTCPVALAPHDATSAIPLSVVWHYSFDCIVRLLWGHPQEDWGRYIQFVRIQSRCQSRRGGGVNLRIQGSSRSSVSFSSKQARGLSRCGEGR